MTTGAVFDHHWWFHAQWNLSIWPFEFSFFSLPRNKEMRLQVPPPATGDHVRTCQSGRRAPLLNGGGSRSVRSAGLQREALTGLRREAFHGWHRVKNDSSGEFSPPAGVFPRVLRPERQQALSQNTGVDISMSFSGMLGGGCARVCLFFAKTDRIRSKQAQNRTGNPVGTRLCNLSMKQNI